MIESKSLRKTIVYKHTVKAVMKTTILHITLLLSCAVSAQTIWYKPDSLVAHPVTDSVPATEEYTVVTVLRNLEPDSGTIFVVQTI